MNQRSGNLSCMRIVAVALFVCCVPAGGAADVTVYQFDHSNIRRVYSVPGKLLLTKDNRWNPATEDLSADIASRAEVARQHLIKKKKPEREIKLYRSSLARYSGHGSRNDGPWYFLFMYGYELREPRGSIETPLEYVVVMLLNGTIANETITITTSH